MKTKIKLIHWIIFLWLSFFVLQFSFIINSVLLIVSYFGLLLNDASSAMNFLNFGFVDSAISSLLFLFIIPLIIILKKRLHFIEARLNFTTAFLILLGFLFLFAPLITKENPEFSKNLAVTKLLPPLSSVKQIELKNTVMQNLSKAEIFRNKFEKIIKPSFNNNIILADSVIIAEQIIYYQKNNHFTIDKEELISENGIPIIEEKFYLLGTDEFGRDIFTRLVFGTRISISVGLGAVMVSFFIGILLGFIAGYRGGILDVLLNRFTEMFLAFPVIYLIVLFLALFGNSIFSVIIVLGISGWMSLFKVVKSEVLSIKQKDFFRTAELVGLNKYHLLVREIIPMIFAPVLVNLIFLFSNVILAEAALSYLGLGTGNSYPSWGSMISSGQEYITKAWWLIAFPGLVLILTLFTFNSSGKMLGRVFNPGIKQ